MKNNELARLLLLSQASYDIVEKQITNLMEKNKSLLAKIEDSELKNEELSGRLLDHKKENYVDLQPLPKFDEQIFALHKDIQQYQKIVSNLQNRLKNIEKENMELMKRNSHLEEELYLEKSKPGPKVDSPFSRTSYKSKNMESPLQETSTNTHQISRTHSPKRINFNGSSGAAKKTHITRLSEGTKYRNESLMNPSDDIYSYL